MQRRRRTPADIAAYISQLPSDESGSDCDSNDEEEILRVEIEEEDEEDTLSEDESGLREDQSHGRDGTAWESMTSSIVGRSSASNVFKANPGPRTPSYVQTPYDTWKLFINEKMLRTICECTNIYATTKDIELNMTIYELEAFIALQYARGIYNRTLPANFLWNKNYGPSIFGTTMSRERFKLILRCLRFDKKSTRTERCKDDRFAAVRDIFEQFRMNCTTKYTPDAYLTIDEQLLPLKTRCKMITYMPNKPDKFGFKFWILAEVETKFVCNILPYLGACERSERGDETLADYVVMRLIEPFQNLGYNVCCDNFFTSLQLAKKLTAKETSVVGTMRKNRRELSPAIVQNCATQYESKFFWQKESKACVVTYQCKKQKNVILLSTMHSSPTISNENAKRKPAIVEFYNANKVGVDVHDQMNRQYSTVSASRRWPLAIWSNLLNIGGINAWILFKKITRSSISRREFILELIESLRQNSNAKGGQKKRMPDENDIPSSVVEKRRKCQHSGCRNCSSTICKSCFKVTCGKCSEGEKQTFVKCKSCAL